MYMLYKIFTCFIKCTCLLSMYMFYKLCTCFIKFTCLLYKICRTVSVILSKPSSRDSMHCDFVRLDLLNKTCWVDSTRVIRSLTLEGKLNAYTVNIEPARPYTVNVVPARTMQCPIYNGTLNTLI